MLLIIYQSDKLIVQKTGYNFFLPDNFKTTIRWPDEPIVLKCNARFIGELKIEDCQFNIQWVKDIEDIIF